MIGAAQIAAILVVTQRLLEEIYSRHNMDQLLKEGAREVGAEYYPVVAATHLGWIGGIFLLISPQAPLYWPLIAMYLALQVARYWVIASLGKYWTHRIITLENAPAIRRGPYRYIRHPNYLITLLETFLLPLAFGAWAFAIIMTAIWAAVLRYKIVLEDDALATRRRATTGKAEA